MGGVSASTTTKQSQFSRWFYQRRKRSFTDEQKEFGWSIFLSTNGFYFTQGVLVDVTGKGKQKHEIPLFTL